MTAPTPAELTTLIAELRSQVDACRSIVSEHLATPQVAAALEMVYQGMNPPLASLESLSATTPTEWEYGLRVSKHRVEGDYDSEASARIALEFEPQATVVRRTPAGPWIPTETEKP